MSQQPTLYDHHNYSSINVICVTFVTNCHRTCIFNKKYIYLKINGHGLICEVKKNMILYNSEW